MSAIVDLDEKGRVLIPAEIRRKIRSRRFRVSTHGGVVELEPLATLEELKGKYRHRSRWALCRPGHSPAADLNLAAKASGYRSRYRPMTSRSAFLTIPLSTSSPGDSPK